jgi:hypothetical protein
MNACWAYPNYATVVMPTALIFQYIDLWSRLFLNLFSHHMRQHSSKCSRNFNCLFPIALPQLAHDVRVKLVRVKSKYLYLQSVLARLELHPRAEGVEDEFFQAAAGYIIVRCAALLKDKPRHLAEHDGS